MRKFLLALGTALAVTAGAARAQDAWVQIEAIETLTEAEQRARAWSGAFEEVNGFRLTSGWYAIALGPFTEEEAGRQLLALRGERLIPRDAFLSDGTAFASRFWPAGAAPVAVPGATDVPQVTTAPLDGGTPEGEAVAALPAPAPGLPEVEPPAPAVPEPVEESPAEARRSEAELGRGEREALQLALQWFGFYQAAIDGAFGRGTRASMSDWQQANGYEATGVLTTRQRAALLAAFDEARAALGLGEVVEDRAGIALTMPVGLVEFDDYAPPFVRYREKDGSGVQVLLISQEGNQATLDGLYDVMQTLEIVPVEGFRERQGQSFVLTGKNGTRSSYTYARLQGGMIKGFTLVYPPSEEEPMQRAIEVMRETLVSTGPALDPTLGEDGAGQARDLLSGLDVRQPLRTRSGVYVDREGAVLTVAEAVEGCGRITIDDSYEARVAGRDAGSGLALLKPVDRLAPPGIARFAGEEPRIGAQAAVGGYPFGPALPAATLTFGTVEDVAGLTGEAGVLRLQAGTEPGDAGGPVFDRAGRLAGVLLAEAGSGDRALPPGVRFAAKAGVAAEFLAGQGVRVDSVAEDGALAPEDLTEAAMGMTVLVSCWK